ncbi:MAG: type II toxin-antitoxin system PemK/MazF family toxin [Chloroflexi bacterium]|nr:type II toxin-antitoxin system PemK/MazF family toxin [Chloroflexota bacterium]
MPDFSSGDVVRVNLDPTEGHEQSGKRPVVVVSHLRQFGLVIIVPLTTRDKGWWTQVRIPHGEGKLSQESVALCHQVRCLSVKRVEGSIGRVSSVTLGKIRTVLGRILES